MEELQKTLITVIDEQLKVKEPDIQSLDVLNRLIETVNGWLITVEANK